MLRRQRERRQRRGGSVTTESACPGNCNRGYREACEAFKAALAAYDPLDANQSRPIPPASGHGPATPGADAANQGSGKPSPNSTSSPRCSPPPRRPPRSPRGPAGLRHHRPPLPVRGRRRPRGTRVHADRMAAGLDRRGGTGPAARPPRSSRRPRTELIAWLNRRLDDILTGPFAADFGAEVLQWHREFTNKTKAGARTLRRPLRCPRPQCRLLTLTWTEGDTHVISPTRTAGRTSPWLSMRWNAAARRRHGTRRTGI